MSGNNALNNPTPRLQPRRDQLNRPKANSSGRWASRGVFTVLTAAILPLMATATAYADVIDIRTYDVIDSPASGSGGWFHTYSQPFVPTGVDSVQGGAIGNYTGGFGTLNDGLISSSVADTHLFFTGTRANPVITVHLAAPVFVDSIEIYGGDIEFNAFPGALSQVTVEIGGSSLAVSPEPFGPLGALGPFNDRVTLTGTPLSDIATDTLVLRNTASPFNQFSIAELRINGRPAAVPPLAVGVDVSPGQKDATITARGNDPIRVAVLSTAIFDAVTAVNKASMKFGRTGQEPSLISCGQPRDVNRDARPDIICSFEGQVAGFQPGDTTGFLTGLTKAGRGFEGTDTIRVRP